MGSGWETWTKMERNRMAKGYPIRRALPNPTFRIAHILNRFSGMFATAVRLESKAKYNT
jgi:hypothetical protein